MTVVERILATNPILEAFGNAVTTKNDNSSRFGKYIQIFFNNDRTMTGATIRTYLLEKTRVTQLAPGESSFHILYQLYCGVTDAERDSWFLSAHSSFKILGDHFYDHEVCAKKFAQTRQAMTVAGFEEYLQSIIFQTLASLMHLMNIKFTEDSNGYAIIDQNHEYSALDCSSRLLQVESQILESTFRSRKIIVVGETFDAPNTVSQAMACRDALCKLLYETIFTLIVSKLNETLSSNQTVDCKFIGILDIYGFEVMDNNSFEQFCINYANEKLQNMFVQQALEVEQALYMMEDIDWSFVKYVDNKACLEAIESKLNGILTLLDEESRLPAGSDSSFITKLFDKSQTISTKVMEKPRFAENRGFILNHYACAVEYEAVGFIEKNRDFIPAELFALFKQSLASGLIRSDIPTAKKTVTTSVEFRNSLSSLVDVIRNTKTHYIRCIKPNTTKEAMKIDSSYVLRQLSACGVLETVKISAAGYPGRWEFGEFYDRYRILGNYSSNKNFSRSKLESDQPTKKKSARKNSSRGQCLELLSTMNLDPLMYKVGKTIVFLRAGVFSRLEDDRAHVLNQASLAIEKYWRVYSSVTLKRRLQKASSVIVFWMRTMIIFLQFRNFRKSSTIITEQFRVFMSKTRYMCELERLATIKKESPCSATIELDHMKSVIQNLTNEDDEITVLQLDSVTNENEQGIQIEKFEPDAICNTSNSKEIPFDETKISIDSNCEDGTLGDDIMVLRKKLENLQFALKKLEENNKDLENINEILKARNIELEKKMLNGGSKILHLKTGIDQLKSTVLEDTKINVLCNAFGIASNLTVQELKQAIIDNEIKDQVINIVNEAQIPDLIETDSNETQARLPFYVFERIVVCSFALKVEPVSFHNFFQEIFSAIRTFCDPKKDHVLMEKETKIFSQSRKFAFWIAIMIDLASVVQWMMGEAAQTSMDMERLGLLLNLRTEIVRLLEELYRSWLSELFRFFCPLAVKTIVDYQSLRELSDDFPKVPESPLRSSAPSTFERLMSPFRRLATDNMMCDFLGIANSENQETSIDVLLEVLEDLSLTVDVCHLPDELTRQLFSHLLQNMSAWCFNQILFRKSFATWRRGIQIQYNVSRLEDWASTLASNRPSGRFFPIDECIGDRKVLNSSGIKPVLIEMEPLTQAVKLLQLAKAVKDVDSIREACPRLTTAQIRKILSIYLPDAFDDGPVPQNLLRSLSEISSGEQNSSETLMEIQPSSVPLQLSIKPISPTPFADLPSTIIPVPLWRIFALIESVGE